MQIQFVCLSQSSKLILLIGDASFQVGPAQRRFFFITDQMLSFPWTCAFYAFVYVSISKFWIKLSQVFFLRPRLLGEKFQSQEETSAGA